MVIRVIPPMRCRTGAVAKRIRDVYDCRAHHCAPVLSTPLANGVRCFRDRVKLPPPHVRLINCRENGKASSPPILRGARQEGSAGRA